MPTHPLGSDPIRSKWFAARSTWKAHTVAAWRRRISPTGAGRRLARARQAGMTTAEYAVGTLAACTFAALLIAVIRSPAIRSTLTALITGALGLGR